MIYDNLIGNKKINLKQCVFNCKLLSFIDSLSHYLLFTRKKYTGPNSKHLEIKKKYLIDELNYVLGKKENIVEKGENAGNQLFLLFPQCFLPIPKGNYFFQLHLFCHLQKLSIWTSIKFICMLKGQKTLWLTYNLKEEQVFILYHSIPSLTTENKKAFLKTL